MKYILQSITNRKPHNYYYLLNKFNTLKYLYNPQAGKTTENAEWGCFLTAFTRY